MGLEDDRILSRWEVIEGWIPGMSECVHANTSSFLWSTSSRQHTSSGSKRELVLVKWSSSSEI